MSGYRTRIMVSMVVPLGLVFLWETGSGGAYFNDSDRKDAML